MEPINDGINEFNVEFHGPKESNVTLLYHRISLFLMFFVDEALTFSQISGPCYIYFLPVANYVAEVFFAIVTLPRVLYLTSLT